MQEGPFFTSFNQRGGWIHLSTQLLMMLWWKGFLWEGGGAWSNLSGSWNEEPSVQSQLKGFTGFSTEKNLTHLASSINET